MLNDQTTSAGQSNENRQLETTLRIQAAALYSAANAIIITDRQGTIQWVNAGFTKLTGYTTAEAIGLNPRVFKSGKHDDQIYKEMWDTVLSGAVWRGEIVNRRKNGSLYPEQMTITPVLSNGEISHFVAVKEDVSERKRAEEAQARLAAIVEFSEDAIISKSLDGTILTWNQSAERLFGYSAEEAIGQPISLIVPPDRADEELAILERLRHGERIEHHETIRMAKGGRRIDVALVISPIRDASGAVVAISKSARDITERKQTEEALRRQAAFLHLSFDAVIVWRLEGGIESWNQGAERLYGYSVDEALGRVTHDLLRTAHPIPWQRMEAKLRESGQWQGELRHFTKSGNEVVVSARLQLVVGVDGVERILEINRDITEHKKADAALRESEQRFRTQAEQMAQLAAEHEAQRDRMDFALKAAGLGEWSLDLKSREISRSLRHDQIFGYSSLLPTWTYDMFLEHVMPEHRVRVDDQFKLALARTGVWEFEAPIRWRDGTIHWVAVRGRVSYDDSGAQAQMIGVINDISERKQTQNALIRAEKLASVGRLATTIAHEINNPLAATMNSLYLVKIDPALPESVKGNLNVAEQELARVAHISEQTLGFHREVGNPTLVDLTEILESTVSLYGPRLKNRGVSLQRRYRISAGVRAVDGEVRQIASNLISNSIDALPENGTLQMRLSGPQTLRGQRRMVRMTIADNGQGMPKENLKQIFEPFFTTKKSVGTGLGLWVTSELVKKHEGKIRVKSSPGKGTVVTVWLPMDRRNQDRRYA